MSGKFSSLRHRVNLLGNLILAIVCIPGCLYLAIGLATLPPDRPGDPDAGKAAALYQFGIAASGLIGVASLVSFRRSSRALKSASARI